MKSKASKKIMGFTLVEMAMVLIILSLLMGGILIPIQKQKDVNAYRETQERIETIKEAILGYAVVKGRLPCPANPYLRTGVNPDAGVSNQNFCNKSGVVPWVELGVPETDAWGRRFTYEAYTDSISFNTPGNISVRGLSSYLAVNLPVVIVSHGKNGYGAYTSEGLQFERDKVSALESDNINNDVSFTSMAHTPLFDDIVDWVSPNVLFNRMVQAGKLP